MGTNFYVDIEPPCQHCGRGGERLHIGKSSAGWQFLFEAHAALGLTSWHAWKAYLRGRNIWDEYGGRFRLADFELIVERKQGLRTEHGQAHLDEHGYLISDVGGFS